MHKRLLHTILGPRARRPQRAVTEVHVSEERFRAFVRATSDIVYEMSADWSEMRSLDGKAFMRTTTRPRVNWMDDYIPNDDQPRVWTAIHDAIVTRSPFECEHRIFRIDGTIGWTFSRAIPFINSTGDIVAWFGAASDITERKQAEEALARSEAKYRTLFDSIDEGFNIIDVIFDEQDIAIDCRILEVNPAYTTMTELSPDIVGQRLRAFMPTIEASVITRYGQVARTGEPVRFEAYVNALDRWFSVHASRVGEAGGFLVAAVFDDITARKRADANQALLNDVSQTLAQLTNVDATLKPLCAQIGAHFAAAVCAFSEVDEAAGTVTSLDIWHRANAISPTGVFPLAVYHSADVQQLMRSGKPEIVRNTASFPDEVAAQYAALNVGAYVNTPLVRNGQWHLTLSITDTKRRDWRADELDLMHELTTRIWTRLERARAEEAVQQANATLETRVQERTQALLNANVQIQEEMNQRMQAESERRALVAQLLTVQEDERGRIARELHDSLGQFLAALKLRVTLAQAQAMLPAEVAADLAQLQQLAQYTDQEVDRLTMMLRPPSLDTLGLGAALETYTEEWSTLSGVPVDLVRPQDGAYARTPAIETTVYRIVQEALTNILKYAQATLVSVIITQPSDMLQVIVEDNGIGFDPARARPGTGGRQVGLIGMRERAALVGGMLTIESAPGQGTTVFVTIPLPSAT